MSLDPQIVGPMSGAAVAVSGAVVALCRTFRVTFLAWLRDRERARWLAASPADRLLIGPPPAILPPARGVGPGPAAALVIGAILSIGLPFATGRAHPIATLRRLRGGSPGSHGTGSAGDRPRDCNPQSCKPPSHCTAAGCVGEGLPVEPGGESTTAVHPPAKGQPATADRKPLLESALAWDNCKIYDASPRGRLPGFAQ